MANTVGSQQTTKAGIGMSNSSTVLTVSSNASTSLYSDQLNQQHSVQVQTVQLGGGQEDHIQTQQQQVTHVQLLPVLPHQPSNNAYNARHTMEVETVISLNQCCICSTFFESPTRPIPHPDLNRMICKVLDVTPEVSFYKDYLPLCVNCTNLLRKFDRLRVELEFVKTQLVTYVMESLMQLRVDGGSQLDGLKEQIFDRWAGGQKGGRKKGKNTKEGYTAVGTEDLSWAAHNNVMESSSTVVHTGNWSAPVRHEVVIHDPAESLAPSVEYQSDDDDHVHGEDDLLHGGDDNDQGVELGENDTEEMNKRPRKGSKTSTKNTAHLPTDPSAPQRKRKKKQKKKSTGQGTVPLICTNCGRIFSQRVTFNGHIQVCTRDDLEMPKNCSVCSEEHNVPWIFETWEEFKDHVNSYHPVVKLETCRFCTVNFLPHGVKHHKCTSQPYRSKVDKEAIFKCDRCDKAYNTQANLVDHVRRLHKDEEHKCDICNKVYGSPMLLDFHVKRHKKVVSKFQCKQCGVCLTTNYGLKEHVKRHTGEQPFECKECGRKFSSLSALRCHKAVHVDKTPHVCHICGMSFKIKSTLSRHVARHQLDETNYTKKCPLCPKAVFRKIWILKKHMESEHSGTAELEDICEKFKDIDDTPKKKDSRSLRGKGRACSNPNAIKKTKKEMTDESEFDEDGMSEDESLSDQEDVKPVIEEDNSNNQDPETEALPVMSSRQSTRLLAKNAKKIVVELTRLSDAQNSDSE